MTKNVFRVIVYDDDKVYLEQTMLAATEISARDKAVKALDDGVDLDLVQVLVRPF